MDKIKAGDKFRWKGAIISKWTPGAIYTVLRVESGDVIMPTTSGGEHKSNDLTYYNIGISKGIGCWERVETTITTTISREQECTCSSLLFGHLPGCPYHVPLTGVGVWGIRQEVKCDYKTKGDKHE